MTITVSMPYFGTPDLVDRAVRSVLGQTHRNIHLVVVGDGEEPPLGHIRDSRLSVYTLPENHGAYFCHQLTLMATPHAQWSPHDSDDWSDPEHLERLAAKGGTATVSGAIWFHDRRGVVRHHKATYWIGLYGTKRLRSFGGFNPAERVGQDSLTLHMLRLSGKVARVTEPTYHRVKRIGSLTTAAETGMRSVLRKDVRARNRKIVRYCQLEKNLAGVRAYRSGLVPASVLLSLGEEAIRLRERLA